MPQPVPLSRQQHAVMQYLANGLSPKEIALAMGLRPDTVRKYIGHVREKAGARSLPHCVALLVGQGALSAPPFAGATLGQN